MPFGVDGAAGELLSGLLNFNGGDGNVGGQRPRVPFAFSSRLRQMVSADAAYLETTSRLPTVGTLGDSIFVDALTNREAVLQSPFAKYLTAATVMPVVETLVNPESVRITQGKRITSQDTQGGKVFWHWVDENGQDNDVALVTLRGHTGNVDLRSAPQDTGAYRKMLIYHNLWLLTREPKRFAGNLNEWSITLSGPLMPVDLTLYGFYSKVMDIDWQAKSPNGSPYELAFTVERTSPSLDEILMVMSEYNLAPPTTLKFGGGSGA